MSNRALAAGVFRAWGLMWSIYVALGIPQFVNTLIRNPYQWEQKGMSQFALSSSAISLGCQVVLAVFLIRQAYWLASIVFPIEQDTAISVSGPDLQTILFCTVGLYFLLDGIRHLVGSGYQLLLRPRGDSRNAVSYLWERSAESLVGGLGGVIVGGYVLLGRGRLLSPWKAAVALHKRFLSLRSAPDE
jgi:hypothetical protein